MSSFKLLLITLSKPNISENLHEHGLKPLLPIYVKELWLMSSQNEKMWLIPLFYIIHARLTTNSRLSWVLCPPKVKIDQI